MKSTVFPFALPLFLAAAPLSQATTTAFPLASGSFTQDWSDIDIITANDDWSGVPSIVGYLGDDPGPTVTAVDPQTLLAGTYSVTVEAIANQTSPNTSTSGGIGEFELANPVVALQGSGTADAPNLVFYLDATGVASINIAYDLVDIDGSADNATQQFALQYRIGDTGDFVNLPGGYVADASTGPSLATAVTPVSVTLPADANGAPLVQVRVITTNAIGSDEWVGVDNIVITSVAIPEPSAAALGLAALGLLARRRR